MDPEALIFAKDYVARKTKPFDADLGLLDNSGLRRWFASFKEGRDTSLAVRCRHQALSLEQHKSLEAKTSALKLKMRGDNEEIREEVTPSKRMVSAVKAANERSKKNQKTKNEHK